MQDSPRRLSPLRQHDFRLLLLGQTTSQLGTQLAGVAVPLLALLTLDASPLELGLLSASGTIPFALIGLPAGAWIDRLRKRPVLVAADTVRAVVLATIPLAALAGVLTMTQLIVVMLLSGLARVFFDVGYQSYLPALVGPDEVLSGNASLETIRATGQVAGPGLGGWLVSVAGAALVLAIQSVTFAVSAVCLLSIRRTETVVERPATSRLRSEIAEGLRYVVHTARMRALGLASAAGNFSFGIGSAATLPFVSRSLHLSPSWIGIVVSTGSVAAMLGAALTPRVARRFGTERTVWLSLAVTGPFAALTAFATPGPLVALVVIATMAGEFGQIVYAVTSVSVRQRICPPALLGRVNATMRVLIMSAFPAGALLGGLVAQLAGLRVALLAGALVLVLSPVPVRRAFRPATV